MNNDKAYQYLKDYKRRYNLLDNNVLNEILEKIFKSDFLVIGENEIIHSSKKYDKYIGKEPSVFIKKLINDKNSSGGKLNIEIIKGSTIQGPFMYTVIEQGKSKGLFIFKYNDKYFNSDNLEVLHKLYEYIRLY